MSVTAPTSRSAAPLSASPRKLIRRAHDALSQIGDVIERYPEARADLERRLGPDLFARVVAAQVALAEANARITPEAAPDA